MVAKVTKQMSKHSACRTSISISGLFMFTEDDDRVFQAHVHACTCVATVD